MLRYLRENTGNWIIKIFLFIIVIVFVFLGVGSMNATKNNQVAVVNDEPITFNEFQDTYKNMVQRMRQQFGNALNDELLKALNIKQQAVNSLIDQRLLDLEAEKLKIRVSDQELQDALLSIKAFQRNGGFDLELYKQVLARNSLTPETFEALQRRAIKETKLKEMVLNSITVSDAEARTWYLFQNTKMAVDYIEIDPATFTDIVPTEEQVKKQYTENPDLYKSQPKRQVQYLVFSPKDQTAADVVTDEQVQAYYEQNISRFKTPEKVEASHILIRLEEGADEQAVAEAEKEAMAVYEKAVKGEAFDELAKEFSQGPSAPKGGYLGVFEKKSMVTPFGNAAFALKPGEISKPVKTQFGWHVIQVKQKIDAKVETLAEASPVIRKELEADELNNLAYYKAGEAFDAVVDGDSFDQVALIAKLKIQETQAFTRDGQGLAMENAPQFAKEAFALTTDDISEVKQLGDSYYLIRVMEKIDPKPLELEAVKEEIILTLTARQQIDAARKKSEVLLKKREEFKTLGDLAQAENMSIKSSDLFTRNQAIQGIASSKPIVDAAFDLDEVRAVFPEVVETGNRFYLIGFKEKQIPGEEDIKSGLDQVKLELAGMKQQQHFMAWMQDLKARADIKINQDVIN